MEKDKESPRIIQDCAPKRALINDQQMFNRLESMQATIDKLEHRLTQFQHVLELLIGQSKEFIESNNVLIHKKEESKGEITYERANTQKH